MCFHNSSYTLNVFLLIFDIVLSFNCLNLNVGLNYFTPMKLLCRFRSLDFVDNDC